jgi:murein DD-endopeptidase MepM/ murein hydrolase activator NlpD
MMPSKRYYLIFVAREDDGHLRKIPIPLHYAYVFVAAAVVGAFTITGMAGSYARMLVKTEHFNQVRQEQEALRRNYQHMEQVAHEKDVQVASLGSLASEISTLYGLRSRPGAAKPAPAANAEISENAPPYRVSLDTFYTLRSQALSGRVTRALEFGSGPRLGAGESWIDLADAPSLWPIEGPITSSFGQRQDPFNGEGAFHMGVDIAAGFGTAVRAPADGTVLTAGLANGYGREIILDNGHGVRTLFGHLSGFAVYPGQQVSRGEVIGYVGISGRSTGPHLHYEVRLRDTPVNPHKYMRMTMQQLAQSSAAPLLTGSN